MICLWPDTAENWVANKNEVVIDTIYWFISKVYTLFTQHYILAPLALVGLVSIYFFIVKIYRKNKALDLRIKRIEREILKDNK